MFIPASVRRTARPRFFIPAHFALSVSIDMFIGAAAAVSVSELAESVAQTGGLIKM
jgi:hypothetical protein